MPNFTTPTEHARAITVQNNLLAIYSAQHNYYNNNGNNYCVGAPCNSLATINTSLSLNFQDDGTYSYFCAGTTCTATRQDGSGNGLVLNLNQAIVTGGGNPTCTLTPSWCP